MNKKKILFGTWIGIFLIGLLGVTYSLFNYNKIGSNEELITGDIYMHYKESNTLTLENAMPSSTYNPNSYFEFTIDGKNTNTKHDIYYDINLLRGDVPTGKQETNRIQDKFLKFRLTEFVENEDTHDLEETEIFTNKKYSDLSNGKRVHVDTISKNTMNEVSHRYRLYMWIDNSVVIGNTENSNKDYDQMEWNNLFSSIKVSATGDFTEKSMSTPASCFITTDNGNNTLTIIDYADEGYKINLDKTADCIREFTSDVNTLSYYNDWNGEETAEAFCSGTGTLWRNTFKEYLDHNWFSDEEVEYMLDNNIIYYNDTIESSCDTADIIIPSIINGKQVTIIGNDTFYNDQLISVEIPSSVSIIKNGAFNSNQLTSVVIPNSVTTIESSAFNSNQLTSVVIPNSVTTIESSAFSSNQLTSVVIPNSVTKIGSYAFRNNQLTSVVIPNSVITIGDYAFGHNQLTSVVIPNSVTTIGYGAFDSNQLTSVEIPNSVTTIGQSAFSGNQLVSVTIGNGITSIEPEAFSKSNKTYTFNNVTYHNNPNLTSIMIDKSCNDIKTNLKYGNNNYYPWLSLSSPYKGDISTGTTIYGSNNEVCDAF